MAPAASEQEPVDPRMMDIVRADTKRWYQKPNLRLLYLILIPTCVGAEWTLGFDGSMMNNLQAVPAWTNYFGNPHGSRLGLINAINSLGMVMAVPFEPYLSKYLGRRWTIAIGSFIMWIGGGIQTGATNTSMFIAARWLMGFGVVFALCEATALIGELSYAKERAVMTSVFNANWYVGCILASGITMATSTIPSTWAWRIPSVLQILFSAIQVFFLPFCPESPRWLVANDRGDEAFKILQKYHAEGDNGEEFVKLEYAQIQSSIALEKEMAKKFLWADVFRDRAMFHRFAVAGIAGFFSQVSGNSLITYYFASMLRMVGITKTHTIQAIILSLNCWALLTSVPLSIICPRYPRRHMFILSSLGMAVAYIAWTIASARYAIDGTKAAAAACVAFIFIYNPFSNIGITALGYTYIVELFPYTQRSQGLAVKQLIGRLGNFFNTYVNPIALDAISWKYYIVYCVWLVAQAFIVYLTFPETHNRTLEELSFFLEGKEMNERVQGGVDKIMGVEFERGEIGSEEKEGKAKVREVPV